MTTLISRYTSDGCVGRCDAKCHDATDPVCTCICGGINHGVGLNAAVENTRALVKDELEYVRSQGFELDPRLAAICDERAPQLF